MKMNKYFSKCTKGQCDTCKNYSEDSENVECFFRDKYYYSPKKQYPCLNPMCCNYRKHVIKDYEVTYDSKSKEQIITLCCKCGFKYARKVNDDEYKIGKIKSFGVLWEHKLEEIILSGQLSLRKIALAMKCDPKTVVKYAEKLGLSHILNSKMKVTNLNQDKIARSNIVPEKYKQDIIELINSNRGISRTQVRNRLEKEYIWLYKNDREWLQMNLPVRRKRVVDNHRVSWKNRDDELLELLQKEVGSLKQLNSNVRITKTLIARRINMLALVEKNLDKLPKSKIFLESIVETVEDFQERRIERVIAELKRENKKIAKWKVYRKAGVKSGYSAKIEEYINYKLT